jgi:hypothetical protein
MTNVLTSIAALSDDELLVEVQRSAASERAATAHVIEVLAEVDARRLYLGEGCSSLFTYCTQVLHLSEHAAYNRIEAARVARRLPGVLDALRKGDVTLTAIGLLGRHLTTENHRELLAAARHKSKREVEQIVAALAPKPDVRASARRLPVRTKLQARARDGARAPLSAGPSSTAATATPAGFNLLTVQQSDPPREASSPAVGNAASPSVWPSEPLPRPVVAPLAPERYTRSVRTEDARKIRIWR